MFHEQVFDENRLTRDDFLGRVELPLVSLPREAEGRSIPNKYYILQPRSARSKVRGGGILGLMREVRIFSIVLTFPVSESERPPSAVPCIHS